MSTSQPTSAATQRSQPRTAPPFWERGRTAFRNLGIGAKLNIGFGILMLVLLLIVALIFSVGGQATALIDVTEDVRVPSALASAQALSNLLRMQAAIRGYLVLGDLQNIDDYNKARERFENNLAQLQELSAHWTNPEDVERLQALVAIFETWAPIPQQLFQLHDNPLENRPALRIEATQVRPLAAELLRHLEQLSASQETHPPSADNQALLSLMLDFRNSLQAMTTNLRAYAITGDLAFKFGYADNLVANSNTLGELERRLDRLQPEQVAIVTEIRRLRRELLSLSETVFAAAEGERNYEDLYLFTTQAAPQAEEMLTLLTRIADEQQRLIQRDLNVGKQRLWMMQVQTILGGLLSLVLGLVMINIFQRSISGPVQRLHAAAQRISIGDLDFRAPVESNDEIGRLAAAFNSMTHRLQETIDNLERLYRISQGVMSARDLSDLVAEVVEGGNIPVINRAVLNLFEFNDQGQVTGMTVIANWYSGRGTPPSPPGTRYLRADLELIDLLRSQEPLFFNDLLQDPRTDPATHAVAERLHIRAMAVLPLWRQEQQIGVLLLEGDEPYEFSEQEIRPYASLLVQLSVAIENRRLLEQTQQRAVELDRAKKQAEAANQAKSDFLARMSHELRTPLNAILGYAHLLCQDESLTPFQRNAARSIRDSGDHLLTLISDILDLSRIEAQRLELYPTNFDLTSFLEGIVEIFRIRIQEKPEVTLVYSPSPGLPAQVHGDAKRLRQVLINLIENAIKFTERGRVIFRVEALTQQPAGRAAGEAEDTAPGTSPPVARLRFQVEDTGIGMSPQEMERIFRPFEQGDHPTLRAQGVGLGLAISQHLLHLMGGSLEVESQPGQGSTFTVTLKLPTVGTTPEAAPGATRTGTREVSAPRVHREDGATQSAWRRLVTREQVAVMLDLAWKGELPALSRYAQELAQADPRCRPLAERVQQMADAFDEEGLLALIESLNGG